MYWDSEKIIAVIISKFEHGSFGIQMMLKEWQIVQTQMRMLL